MCEREYRRPRTRRVRSGWSFGLVVGLGWSVFAVAAEGPTSSSTPAALVTAGDRPTRAPAHADCGMRMPRFDHVVESGEHLGRIAGRYGVQVTELVALNPQLADPNLIRNGEIVRVCPEIFPRLVRRVEHVVVAGETLSSIADHYGISVDVLVQQQPGAIVDRNLVRIGQRLMVEVDGGLVPDFLPPLPQKGHGSHRRRPRPRVTVGLSPNDHVHIKRPNLAYGTTKTIGLLEQVVTRYRSRHRGAPKVLVGDISRKGGGALRPHRSHRTGRDIDLGYVLRGSQLTRTRFGGVTPDTLDVARTWALIREFVDTDEVVFIFVDYRIQQRLYDYAKTQGMSERALDRIFQYPHGRKRAHGIIRHWPSHKHHFHVRFRR